jgi:hypothetical protein
MWPVRIMVSLMAATLWRAVAYCAGRQFVYTLTGYCKPHGEERAPISGLPEIGTINAQVG